MDTKLQQRGGQEDRLAHSRGHVRETDAVLGRPVCRQPRHDHPETSVRRLYRRQVARRTHQLETRGHRALQIRRLQAGRHGARRDQHQLPRREPALFRHDRNEGRRRRRFGGACGDPDRRVRLRMERAGRRRDPEEARGRRQRQGRDHARRQHRIHPAQPGRSVDRGRRRARQPEEQTPDFQRPGCAPGDGVARRPQGRAGFHLRPHRRRNRQLHQQPAAVPQPEYEVGVQRRQGQCRARSRGLEERRRWHPRKRRQEVETGVTRPQSMRRARKRRPSSSKPARRPASTWS